jgi:ribonuclease HI
MFEGLGTTASVFQAELNAIIIGIIEITRISEPLKENFEKFGHISGNPVCIVSDSKASILAIDSHIVKSEMVRRCKGLLLKLSERCPVSIKWIKAHAGHAGNDLADAKAKAGARLEIFGPEPIIPVSKSWFKSKITQEMCAKWSWKWLSSPICRQTKIFFKSPCKIKSKQLLQSGREKFGKAFRWLSGHNFLRRHNNLLNRVKYPSSMCRMCGLEEETSSHVIMQCEALGQLRLKVFGKHLLTELDNWKVKNLLKFLDYPRVARLEEFPQ